MSDKRVKAWAVIGKEDPEHGGDYILPRMVWSRQGQSSGHFTMAVYETNSEAAASGLTDGERVVPVVIEYEEEK